MAEKKEQLFAQFKPVTTEEWRAKVEVDLKGADFNKKLVWRTNEGFDFDKNYLLLLLFSEITKLLNDIPKLTARKMDALIWPVILFPVSLYTAHTFVGSPLLWAEIRP